MRYRKSNIRALKTAQRPEGALRQSFILSGDPIASYANRGKTVCFTGHRVISAEMQAILSDRLDCVLRALYARGYRYFVSGGALGFDMLAAEGVMRLQADYPDAQLVLALPCGDQSSRWHERDCRRYERILYASNETHVLAPTYYTGCMQVRNRYMVDRAAFCLCYLEHMKGGTVSTVAYAVKEKLPVLNIAMVDACAAFIKDSPTENDQSSL